MDVLRFTFQNFWHFAGVAILLYIIFNGLGHMFSVRVKKVYMDEISDKDFK